MRFVILLLALALAACAGAPAAKTYTYVPPPTPGGRLCSNQCLEAQDYCHETCDLNERSCVNDVQAQALRDYDQYVRDQFDSREPMELRLSDFERLAPCTEVKTTCYGNCENHYQVCYQNCGGKVSVITSCRLLCF